MKYLITVSWWMTYSTRQQSLHVDIRELIQGRWCSTMTAGTQDNVLESNTFMHFFLNMVCAKVISEQTSVSRTHQGAERLANPDWSEIDMFDP
mmetsp:Transcript_102689/g.268002  ORF Transcript_102689/g.268002 Transcript_102689/m.268002 type:complete len:93 (+) Transcript_102689:850-1128(+)